MASFAYDKTKIDRMDITIAVNFVFSRLYEEFQPQLVDKQLGGAFFTDILQKRHLLKAFSCFKSVQSVLAKAVKPMWWWWKSTNNKSSNKVHATVEQTHRMSPNRMNPANFLVQRNDEMICGYIAVFTMLSKSTDLCNLFKLHMQKQKKELDSHMKELRNREVDKQVILNGLDRKISSLEFNKINMKRLLDDSKLSIIFGIQEINQDKQERSIREIDAELAHTRHMKFLINLAIANASNEIPTGIVKSVQYDIIRNEQYAACMKVLFEMSENADILKLLEKGNNNISESERLLVSRHFMSMNFDKHRLLDQLERLFPNSLQWLPYGASVKELYTYAISMFAAAGLDSNHIAFVRTMTDEDGRLTFSVSSIGLPLDQLYVHIMEEHNSISNPFRIPGSFYPVEEAIGNHFDFSYPNHHYKLGGFVFASKQNDYTGHVICGFRNQDEHYVFDGTVDKSNVLPCPPTKINWSRMFASKQGFYIDCGLKEIDEEHNENKMVFKYPFGGFFGMGVHNTQSLQTLPSQAPDVTDVTDVTDLWHEYNTLIEMNTQDEFSKILRLSNKDSDYIEILDELYALASFTKTRFRVHIPKLQSSDSIQLTIDNSSASLLMCINFIVMHILAQSIDLGQEYGIQTLNTMRESACKMMLSDNMITHVCHAWVVDILVVMAANEYKDLQLSSPISKVDTRIFQNINGVVKVVFDKVRPIYDPACIACEYMNYLNYLNYLNMTNVMEVEFTEWVRSKADPYIPQYAIFCKINNVDSNMLYTHVYGAIAMIRSRFVIEN
jgi:hypothetical protein